MNDKPMTLREKVNNALWELGSGAWGVSDALNAICEAIEDTGSPAHMRVAKELRGE